MRREAGMRHTFHTILFFFCCLLSFAAEGKAQVGITDPRPMLFPADRGIPTRRTTTSVPMACSGRISNGLAANRWEWVLSCNGTTRPRDRSASIWAAGISSWPGFCRTRATSKWHR